MRELDRVRVQSDVALDEERDQQGSSQVSDHRRWIECWGMHVKIVLKQHRAAKFSDSARYPTRGVQERPSDRGRRLRACWETGKVRWTITDEKVRTLGHRRPIKVTAPGGLTKLIAPAVRAGRSRRLCSAGVESLLRLPVPIPSADAGA